MMIENYRIGADLAPDARTVLTFVAGLRRAGFRGGWLRRSAAQAAPHCPRSERAPAWMTGSSSRTTSASGSTTCARRHGAIRKPPRCTTWSSSAAARPDWSRRVPPRRSARKVALVERDAARRRLPERRLRPVEGAHPHGAAVRRDAQRRPLRRARRETVRVDFPAVMERMRRIRARVSRGDSAAAAQPKPASTCSSATRASPGRTRCRRRRRRGCAFERALIATGARPDTPRIPGLAEAGYLTNENVFDLTELPQRLLVIGGGPLGCELAQAFCRFGARTTIAQDIAAVPAEGGARRRAAPLRCASRATASRCGSTRKPCACASRTARSSSISSATTTTARSRSTRS